MGARSQMVMVSCLGATSWAARTNPRLYDEARRLPAMATTRSGGRSACIGLLLSCAGAASERGHTLTLAAALVQPFPCHCGAAHASDERKGASGCPESVGSFS